MQTEKTPENFVAYDKNGNATSFVGKDAVDLYRCAALAASMSLFKSGLRHSRMSGRQALDEATKYTGNKYKRGEYDKAREELKALIQTRKAVMPTVQEAA